MHLFDKSTRLLQVQLGGGPRLMLLLAAVLTAAIYLFPLWTLTMFAPQYPDGLRLDIYSYKLEGGNNGQDVKEINLLNHYIGMKDLAEQDFTEFKWMPFVVGALGLLFLRAAVHGTVGHLLDVVVPLRVLRRVLPLVLRIQTLQLWAPPGADRGGEDSSVHAAARRLQATGELRGVFVSGPGGIRARPDGRPAVRRPRARVAVTTREGCSRMMMLAALVIGGALATQPGSADHPSVPGALEGRPPAHALSPLQAQIDAAAPGATVEIGPGTYAGDIVLDRPVRLLGRGRPRLVGSGEGSVVRIRAADVTIDGLDIDGNRGGVIDRDSSGIHIAAPGRRSATAGSRTRCSASTSAKLPA